VQAAWACVAQRQFDDAAAHARAALQVDPDDWAAQYLTARLDSLQRLDRRIAEQPSADAHDARGAEYFKLGLFAESIADFDAAIRLDPQRQRGHWRRGIAYYYARQFENGQRQFEAYQTFDDNDVENAVWRYLCMVPRVGADKARADLLRIRDDRRVPMMQIYALFAGQARVDDVLDAVGQGQPAPSERNARLFYAHLYLGLYYDAAGQHRQAAEHMQRAVTHRIGHYMWDVAYVHHRLLQNRQAEEP
jgi:lipoprotein NlpI